MDKGKYGKAVDVFLENRGEKVDGDDDALIIVPDDTTNVKEKSKMVLHHWILDSAKIGKLLPVKYYFTNGSMQSSLVLSGKRIRFETDESDPEQVTFYEELSQEAIKFGATLLHDGEVDMIVTQFVCSDYDTFSGYASPFWLLRILCSGVWEQPYLSLDYPCPLDPIVCEKTPTISLSGFSHVDREPLIAMITLAGGIYTTDLTEANTHLISGGKETEKVRWARIWNVPVYDQNWLERCFFQWQWLNK